LFDLGENFDELYYKKLVDTLLEANEITAAAKVLINCNLYRHFDVLSILKKLGQKGKKNREYAIQILRVNKQFIIDVVNFFTNETTFEFAFEIVQEKEFKLNLQQFPELQTIKSSRHPIVDMAFTDPATDPRHVPLHVMEDLISGDVRLLQKMFFALVRCGKVQAASGLYHRHNMASKGTKTVQDAFNKLPPYDPNQDIRPKDTFGTFRQGNYLSLPPHVKVHMVLTEFDCKKIDLLVG